MRKCLFFTLGFVFSLLFWATDYAKIPIALVYLLGYGLAFTRFELPYLQKSLLFSLVGAVFGWGYFNLYQSHYYDPLDDYVGEKIYVECEVLDFPNWETYSYSVMVEVILPNSKVKTLLYMDQQASELAVGDRFWTEALLRSAGETFQGDSITYYTAKGIMLRGVASGELLVEPVERISPRHWPTYAARWLKTGISQAVPSRYEGLVLALVTGNREKLSDDFSASLTRTGLSHTVAVSGMHLAFLAGALRLLLPSGRRWTSFLVIFVMVSFMLISGSTPSIMRATVMIVMLHLAPMFMRERDDITALATAILLILLQNPYSITHVGLHLSVASVAGILLFSDATLTRLKEKFGVDWEYGATWPVKLVLSSISATSGAMVFTTPLVAYYFGSISLIAPLSNLLTLGAVSISFAGGLIVGIIGGISPIIGKICAFPLVLFWEYLQRVVTILSGWMLSAITMDSIFYKLWLALVYGILLAFYLYRGKKRWIIPCTCCIFSFMMVFTLHRFVHFSANITMDVLDVGQGQAILLTVGDKFIVSDCGGSSYDNPGDMVADRVQALGENRVHLLVLSHCHTDHSNGVLQLMNRVHVEAIAMPEFDPENPVQAEIVEKARECGTEIWYITEKTQVSLGDNEEIVLFPPVGSGDMNEEGLTLLVTSGEQDILVTGDMNMQTEEILISTFELPDIEILVVGHHGSKYSTSLAFLEAIQTEIAVISVSSSNTYGHPTKEVLDKLELYGIDVYRTDYDGVVRFRSAG